MAGSRIRNLLDVLMNERLLGWLAVVNGTLLSLFLITFPRAYLFFQDAIIAFGMLILLTGATCLMKFGVGLLREPDFVFDGTRIAAILCSGWLILVPISYWFIGFLAAFSGDDSLASFFSFIDIGGLIALTVLLAFFLLNLWIVVAGTRCLVAFWRDDPTTTLTPPPGGVAVIGGVLLFLSLCWVVIAFKPEMGYWLHGFSYDFIVLITGGTDIASRLYHTITLPLGLAAAVLGGGLLFRTGWARIGAKWLLIGTTSAVALASAAYAFCHGEILPIRDCRGTDMTFEAFAFQLFIWVAFTTLGMYYLNHPAVAREFANQPN